MTRVTPREVVALIDRIVPGIEAHDPARSQAISVTDTVHLALLVDQVERIPPELTPADSKKKTELLLSVALIRSELQSRYAQGGGSAVDFVPLIGDLHPFGLIRHALAGLPDDVPSPETETLLFIDEDLRTILRQDISWASSALRNREWKAATVLAGSVIEALLYWELQQHPSKPKVRKDSKEFDRWDLQDYITAAEWLKCVKDGTVIAARLAKDYRNLIHHGRAERLGEACDHGTAHFAIGALAHVVRDLENRECPRHRREP